MLTTPQEDLTVSIPLYTPPKGVVVGNVIVIGLAGNAASTTFEKPAAKDAASQVML